VSPRDSLAIQVCAAKPPPQIVLLLVLCLVLGLMDFENKEEEEDN
jgi:hypothetical protein